MDGQQPALQLMFQACACTCMLSFISTDALTVYSVAQLTLYPAHKLTPEMVAINVNGQHVKITHNSTEIAPLISISCALPSHTVYSWATAGTHHFQHLHTQILAVANGHSLPRHAAKQGADAQLLR